MGPLPRAVAQRPRTAQKIRNRKPSRSGKPPLFPTAASTCLNTAGVRRAGFALQAEWRPHVASVPSLISLSDWHWG